MKKRTVIQSAVGDTTTNRWLVLIQAPNLPLALGLVCYGLNMLLPSGKGDTFFGVVGFGAMFTWAWLELFKGVNWFRRLLGLAILVVIVTHRL